MAPVRGRLPEVLVKDALRSLAKRRPVVGNNKEETSAIFYFFALAAATRDVGADFTKGFDLGSKSNPEGRAHFLRHFRIFHQIGKSQCFISELGDIHGSDKSSDQVARANFLSTFLERAAKVGPSGLDYPSRPKDAFLIKGGVQVSDSRFGVRMLPQWKGAMVKILSFRQTTTPWHSLAIVLVRKYEFESGVELTDLLIGKVGELFVSPVGEVFQDMLRAERGRMKAPKIRLAGGSDDPLAGCAPSEEGGGDLWEARRRIGILEAFIRQKGFDPP